MADYITPSQIARAAHCSREAVLQHIAQGKLRATSIPGRGRSGREYHVDPADAAPWIEAMREHKEREIVRPDLAKTGKRGAAVTKRWTRIAERLRTVKAGERAHVSLGARNKARARAREHLARRAGDTFDE